MQGAEVVVGKPYGVPNGLPGRSQRQPVEVSDGSGGRDEKGNGPTDRRKGCFSWPVASDRRRCLLSSSGAFSRDSEYTGIPDRRQAGLVATVHRSEDQEREPRMNADPRSWLSGVVSVFICRSLSCFSGLQ